MNRTMTRVLAEELSKLTASERRAVVRLAATEDLSPLMSRLFRGLMSQVLVDQATEDAVLHALEADHRAEVEAVDSRLHGDPLPVAGDPATFDPDTQEWRIDEG